MKTISELKQYGSDSYFAVFEDGETLKTVFSVVADHALYSGRELTEEEYEAVKTASELGRCKARAMRIVSARACSEMELYEKLLQKGETEQNAAESVAYMKGLHLLDDRDYARMLVRHYGGKGYGAARIKSELYHRRVPKELWDEALEEMPRQDDAIDRFINSRLRGQEPDRKELKRVTDALLRRGFSYDEIRSAVMRYSSGIEDD